ncbi:ribbon-helix-helix protein, CopG family [Archaeoglobus fulgidus]|uniref:Ribbon-helix-helix protein CopG domain-containing protein n=4 Tax=Archaeoglobus TaxID=2233 RepID=O30109_ARCFU|nr:ribbon-helix-helix protein, CopG family [Archaeoglobus fulgidus]AAB91105.1 predicted coding region AF_0128 [Archaeoglobus fulgidus DSM 4304]AIG96965.1 Ribbon-helix-helix protein, copG family [Archaeoglobus fulgidus DSM 8774]KUJ94670.1 MAG: hypothetical protein XD40_0234 [Archaeoglobus fulgidus]KUK05293.1 MAG: hypothetical protein XD48_2473 [Archaeoglobus fulgidus]
MPKFKRLSVAVDDSIVEILEKLTAVENKTVSDIIRESIITYAELAEGGARISDLKQYEDILERRDHVMVDLEMWIALLDLVNAKADEEFWKLIENVGYELGVEMKLKGFGLDELLEHMRIKNLLNYSREGGIYILTLVSRSATNMVMRMLRGAFRAMQIEAEVIPGVRKVVIVDKKALKDKDVQKWIAEMGRTFEGSDWPMW